MKKFLSALGHQDWLRFGLRYRIINIFHPPEVAQDEPFEVDFFGKRYLGNFNTHLDWCVYYYGAYMKEELLCMRDFLEPITAPVVVDVGANVGHHSLFASTVASSVHSFEPFPPVREKLEEKIRANSLTNVTVHKVGLGDERKILSFSPPSTNNTGTGSFCNPEKIAGSIKLDVHTADEFFNSVGISKIDYLKMDIEGFEVHALKGLKDTLQRHRPVCFIEWTQNSREQGLTNGIDLFPQDYIFYRFVAFRPFMLFFNLKNYQLVRLNDDWTDGNLVAVPREYAEQVTLLKPTCIVARRLKGD